MKVKLTKLPTLPRLELYIFLAVLYVYPLCILFINSLNGLTMADALQNSFRLFFTPGPGLVVWLQVFVLDLLISLYAWPIFNVCRCALQGEHPQQCSIDHAMNHLNWLPQKVVGISVGIFVAAAVLRAWLEQGLPGSPANLNFGNTLFIGVGEAVVTGNLVGVILALHFENRLFRVRETILALKPKVPMLYASMYGKVFMILFAIVLYVVFATFTSMGSFFSLGIRNPGLLPDAKDMLMTGPQLLMQGNRFKGLKDVADVFALRLGLFSLFMVHLLWQMKQLFSHPLKTVLKHLRQLNSPDADKAVAINILQNDEYAPVYREINALIAKQQDKIEVSEKRLSGIIRNAADPIVAFDREFIVRVFNPAAERLFEYAAAEVLGKPLATMVSATNIDIMAAHTDGIARLEWTCRHGKRLLMESHVSETSQGSDEWTTVILRDITAQVELAETLTRAKQEAETASRMKSEFLANMSHELRTPLNAVLGFTQLMSGDKNLTDVQKDRIRIISRSGEHLLSLINDILDISKIEAGKMELHPVVFNLPDFIGDLRDMFGLKCQAKGLTLYTDTLDGLPTHVRGDLGKLRQVLINLLGNAVKFTDEGGISILVGEEAGRIRFAIQDTGRGIPAEEQTRILQPFVQASGSDHEGGTGLGLAISSHFISLMGGRLEVVSSPGRGSTFAFSLELPATEQAAASDQQADFSLRVRDGQAITALIVDDQLTNRLVLKEMLERSGFQVIEAQNGREAVDRAQEQLPAMIFMDIKMPVLDGYGAVKLLKNNNITAGIKAFALTASAFSHDENRIREAGFDGFLAKPFKVGQLYALIRARSGLDLEYQQVEASALSVSDGDLSEEDYASAAAAADSGLVDALGEAAAIGDYGGLAALADRLTDAAPAFAAALRQGAAGFDEAAIGRMLERLAAGREALHG